MLTCEPAALLTKALARQLTFLWELALMLKQILHWGVWPGSSWQVDTWWTVPGGLRPSLTRSIINGTKDVGTENKQR